MPRLAHKPYHLVIILNVTTILIVAIMLMVSQAFAKPDHSSTATTLNTGVLSYQGTLMDTAGNPLTGTYEITFRIYDAPSDGTLLWEEVRSGANAVPVQQGLFNVMLGSLNPIPDTVWEAADLFMGVKIGNDSEMSPREQIGAVPYALRAGIALSVPIGSLNSTHVNFTSGSKNSTADIELNTSYQIIPGMQSTITLTTPQTLFVMFTAYFTSNATSGYGTAYVKVTGDSGTFQGPLIVASWPATDTYSKAYLFDLPEGTYEIQAWAKSYSGTATLRSAWTNMNWFAFSQ